MTEQPENLTLVFLRRIDAKLDTLVERTGNLETEMVQVRRHLALIAMRWRMSARRGPLSRIVLNASSADWS